MDSIEALSPPPPPKILIWDIETSQNVVAVFQLKQDYIQPENILRERHLISAAWKWLGERKVEAVSLLDSINPETGLSNLEDDTFILQRLHEVLSEADVIVAHNGDKFDIKFVEARMLIKGLPPLPPITKVDTLKVARKRFLFNSNKLDYLGHVLGCGRKKKTSGSLWLKILNGDVEAVKKMVAYNKQDVILLEKVFLKLRPFIPNLSIHENLLLPNCPKCGSMKVQYRGLHKTLTRTYKRLQCQKCGGWHRQLKAEPTTTSTRSI